MIIDLHCDTIKKAYENKINLEDKQLQFRLSEAEKLIPYIQTFATFIDLEEQEKGFEVANKVINNFYDNLYDENKMFLIKNKNDLKSPELKEKIGIILSIENGSAISENLSNIDYFYEKGIRIMSIVWNEQNKLASGANTINDTGLTELGKEYIKKLKEKKILIDVSHTSNKTFWDTVKLIDETPCIATHSCAKKLCDHKRNLSDAQIKQIAKTGGLIGVTYVNDFLKKEGKASSIEVVNHIDYIANLVGIDYVALGGDFDGIKEYQKPEDIKSVRDVENIIKELNKRGYNKNDINKITANNFIRIINMYLN